MRSILLLCATTGFVSAFRIGGAIGSQTQAGLARAFYRDGRNNMAYLLHPSELRMSWKVDDSKTLGQTRGFPLKVMCQIYVVGGGWSKFEMIKTGDPNGVVKFFGEEITDKEFEVQNSKIVHMEMKGGATVEVKNNGPMFDWQCLPTNADPKQEIAKIAMGEERPWALPQTSKAIHEYAEAMNNENA